MFPSWMMSERASPLPMCLRAMLITSLRLASVSSHLASVRAFCLLFRLASAASAAFELLFPRTFAFRSASSSSAMAMTTSSLSLSSESFSPSWVWVCISRLRISAEALPEWTLTRYPATLA